MSIKHAHLSFKKNEMGLTYLNKERLIDCIISQLVEPSIIVQSNKDNNIKMLSEYRGSEYNISLHLVLNNYQCKQKF